MGDFVPRERMAAAATIDLARRIHSQMGPGLPEKVYEEMLARGLSARGFEVQTQVHIPAVPTEKVPGGGFQADLMVDGCILVELKSVDELQPDHHMDLVRNLDMSHLGMALLVNFGEARLDDGIYHFSACLEGRASPSGRDPAERRRRRFQEPE